MDGIPYLLITDPIEPRVEAAAAELIQDRDLHFAHWLALKLGWRSVGEMESGMSEEEHDRWKAYFVLEWQSEQLAELARS